MTKVQKFIEKNKYGCIAFLFIVAFFMINIFDLKNKLVGSDVSLHKIVILYSLICGALVALVSFLFKKFKNGNNIAKVFLILSILIGTCYIGASPLFSGSDEHNHYYRIYEITEGTYKTPVNKYVGGKLPTSLAQTFIDGGGSNAKIKYGSIEKMHAIKLDQDNTKQYGVSWNNQYSNTALYSPLSYTPHVIGFLVGKIIGMTPYAIGMLGRIANLITYSLLGYMALKVLPRFKMFYFAILLSPNMLQCAATLSADAFTNVIILLFIAYVYYLCASKDKINIKDEALLFVLSVFIALCKITYLPIVFAVLFIEKDKYKNNSSEKIVFSLLTVFVATIISLLWMRSTNGIFEIFYPKSELQKAFIFGNIIEYGIIFLRTFAVYGMSFIECLFVGNTMYHSQLLMPGVISYSYVILVIYCLLGDRLKNEMTLGKRLIIVVVGIAIIGLISSAIYVQCTAQFFEVASPIIQGIQGRYFIPVIMLLPFVISGKKLKYKFNNELVLCTILCINAITLFYIINHFII